MGAVGAKNIPKRTIDDYVPIEEILAENDPRLVMANYLGENFYEIYCMAANVKDSEVIAKAFIEFEKNPVFMKAIKILERRFKAS